MTERSSRRPAGDDHPVVLALVLLAGAATSGALLAGVLVIVGTTLEYGLAERIFLGLAGSEPSFGNVVPPEFAALLVGFAPFVLPLVVFTPFFVALDYVLYRRTGKHL